MDTHIVGDFFDSLPDAVAVVNAAGQIVLTNTQAERVFGYARGELKGISVDALLPARGDAATNAAQLGPLSNSAQRSVTAGALELSGIRKNGEVFPMEITSSSLVTEEGSMSMYAIRDATERRRHEDDLHEVNRLKIAFLADMSHELRTPLNGIIGFSEFLIDEKPGPLNEKQREYLGDVLSSGRELLQLIDDILDLSKIDSGKLQVHPETFVTETAIDEVFSVLLPLVRKKSISIRREVAPDARSVTLDRRTFTQVLYNLLSNGINFSDDGGAIAVLVDLDESNSLRLKVTDTGAGIDPADYPHLFLEFKQLESGRAPRLGGTGLGLALTKKIVELQGGRIDVHSERGAGSTFTVHLLLLNPVHSELIERAGGA